MYGILVKGIWDLAISGQVLPFTLLLVPIILYWLMAAIGALDLEFLNVDFDAHVDTDIDVDVDAGNRCPSADRCRAA
ncbi:MAG: hypothetical protein VCA34_12105 [Roseibacillus sp.]